MPFFIVFGILLALTLIVVTLSYICYKIVFFSKNAQNISKEDFPLPPGKIYEPYYPLMKRWMQETREMPCEWVSITSFDGLTLWGRYYEYAKGAPIELLFHGYRGTSDRDLCGGVQRCFALGRSVLLIDQRGSGRSEGHVISFGINEHKDCLRWIDFAIEKFGKDVTIMLGGISMGASTVLMAAGKELPKNVVCVLGDCGFSSPKAIIQKVVRQMHLPPFLVYPFIKLGAKLFGKFDLEETSPLKAMETCKLPVLLIHGEADDFVPCEMSCQMYEVCPTIKKLVVMEGAGHGACYLKGQAAYIDAIKQFETECQCAQEI